MDEDFVAGLIFASIAWILILWFVTTETNNSWKDQIEAHGCGGYYLDTNRVKQWNWKP